MLAVREANAANSRRLLAKWTAWTWLGAILLGPIAVVAHAQIPGTITYQGSLKNGGVAVNDTKSMAFSIYDDPAAGNLLWVELQSVPVTGGIFTVALGSGTLAGGSPLGSLPFDKPYHLAVMVDGQSIGPRQALATTPYAMRAAVADSVNPTAPLLLGSNSTAPCDSSHAGSVRWNSLASSMQLCDGQTWRFVTMGPPTYTVGGMVSGFVGPMQLLNNGNSVSISANGSYVFPVPVATGATYSVTVQMQPPGKICSVANGSGTMGSANVSNVDVSCVTLVPLLSYTFEGNGLNSGSDSGHALNIFNSSFAAGKVGQALSFSASGYAQALGMQAALGVQPKLTVAFWSKQSVWLSGQAIWDVSNRTVIPYGGVQVGQSSSFMSVCVSTTSNAYLTGGCNGFTSPSTGVWHHWIIRYNGTGTAAGQGGITEIYVDDVLMHTRLNDGNNNPVFTTTGIPDLMSIGGANSMMDELNVYSRVFSQAEQCTAVIGGTWTGSSCTLP